MFCLSCGASMLRFGRVDGVSPRASRAQCPAGWGWGRELASSLCFLVGGAGVCGLPPTLGWGARNPLWAAGWEQPLPVPPPVCVSSAPWWPVDAACGLKLVQGKHLRCLFLPQPISLDWGYQCQGLGLI